MTAVNIALSKLFFGAPRQFKALTMFPLNQSEAKAPNYVTLDEALNKGFVEVSEISESGSAPHLKLVNRGPESVLLLDGEELVGAKQNRVLNMSIMAPGNSEIVIPVSCVEAGRWNYRSRGFKSAGRVQFNRGRAKKVASVSASMMEANVPRSDQGEVWDEIADKGRRMRSSSATGAMSDIFEDYGAKIDAYVAAMTPSIDQVGGVFFIGGRVAGMDLFDCPATFAKQSPKLLRGYALDAVEQEDQSPRTPSTQEAVDWIETLKLASQESYPAVGIGRSVRINDRKLVGAALEVEQESIHVYAAPVMDDMVFA